MVSFSPSIQPCCEKIVIIFPAGCVFGTGLIVYGMCVIYFSMLITAHWCIIAHDISNCNTFPKVYNMLIFFQNSNPLFFGAEHSSRHLSASLPQSTRTASSPIHTTLSHGIRKEFFGPQILKYFSDTNTAQIFPQEPSISKSHSQPSRRPSHTLMTSSSRRFDVLIIIASPPYIL